MIAATAGDAVAVCIVTYNSAADLPACLEAVMAQDHRPLEVVVVDCASADAGVGVAAEILGRGDLPARTVPLDDNRGFAGGMNEAFRNTAAPFLLTLNADARPEPDYVRRLVDRARCPGADLRVGAVTGRLVRPRAPGGDRERLLDACGMVLTPTWRHLDRGSGEPDRGQHRRAERVFGATGAASLFVREALEDVRLGDEVFDEAFHSFREDAELCFRLRERGWEVLYEPAARAEHRRRVLPAGRRDLPAAVNYHSLKNRYLLRLYHQTAGNVLRTPAAIVRDLLALVYVLARERTSLPAYAWLWRHRRWIRERRRRIQGRRTVPPAEIDRWFRQRALPLGPPGDEARTVSP